MAEFCMTVCMSMSKRQNKRKSPKTKMCVVRDDCALQLSGGRRSRLRVARRLAFTRTDTDTFPCGARRPVGGAWRSDRRGLVLRPDNQCLLGGVTTKASDQLLISFFLGQGKREDSSCLLPGLLRPSTSQAATQGGEACPRDESSLLNGS